MTRFARAKGSKASNEKAPEDGTPWEVMKEQLLKAKQENEDSKKRQEAENQRLANYENFLKERRTQKRPASWCDFPDAENNIKKVKKVVQTHGQTDGLKIKKQKKNMNAELKSVETMHVPIDIAGQVKKKKKNKQNQSREPEQSELISKDANNKGIDSSDCDIGSKKQKKKKQQSHGPSAVETKDHKQQLKNKKKEKKWKKIRNVDETGTANVDPDIEANIGDNISVQNIASKSNMKVLEKNNEKVNQQNKMKAKKKKKFPGSQPARRKEINDKSFQLIINGKEVELVRFDGFPIMKKDAERLAELKTNMMNKGIPKSEVQRTMKLERRRAEKALARVKREVCYNCRKGGHNLSDCPELKSKIPGADVAEGVCFKCGSTEHRQFECKVQRDNEFRFASCFICKEQGHIARQCPDNPKGLYPNGGCCKLCGDVTHLRKDCPTANNKKEESTSLKLQTLESSENIEDIGVQNTKTEISVSHKKPKKIKF